MTKKERIPENLLVLVMVVLVSSMRLYCVSATPTQPLHITRIVVNASNTNCINDTSSKLREDTAYCMLADALYYAMGNGNNTQIHIALGTYRINNETFTFHNRVNFSITGECTDGEKCTKITCTNGAGLRFVDSGSIIVHNLEFIECGAENHNYMYHNDINEQAVAAVAFEYCTSLQLTKLSFIMSTETALALINPIDSVDIIGCKFINSQSNSTVCGGGVQIHLSVNQMVKIVLQHCLLANNTAELGGGLCVNITNVSAQSSLLVKDCQLDNNQARNGGGIFAKFYDSIKNNSIVVDNSTFDSNTCQMPSQRQHHQCQHWCYGGGVGLEVFTAKSTGNPANNRIHFTNNCSFSNNKATNGAAVSIATAPGDLAENYIKFSDSFFYKNSADFGFAVYVHAPDSQGGDGFVTITFSDSKFSDNHKSSLSLWDYGLDNPIGQGAVYTADVPLYFDGKLDFHCNNGTAVTIVRTELNITSNATVIFTENQGNYGGALALLKGGFVNFHKHVHLEFTNNYAEIKGGAIYISDLYWDTLLCPIHQESDSKWVINVSLHNNTVGTKRRLNSVFIPSISTCGGKNQIHEILPFCWEHWHYDDGKNCTHEVETAPSSIQVNEGNLSAFLGQSVLLPVQLCDDYSNDVTSINVVKVSLPSEVLPLNIAKSPIKILQNTTYTYTITITTTQPRILSKDLQVNIVACPPGYTANDHATCVCDQNTYGGHDKLSCGSNFTAMMDNTWCMTLYDSNNTVVVSGMCWPYMKKNMTERTVGFIDLPKEQKELDDRFCHPMKRTGTLCSKCIEGFGLPVLSYEVSCIKCNSTDLHWNVLLYIAAQYIPLTFFLLLIVVLKVSINNGYANSFVLFAQLLTHPFMTIRVQHIMDQQDIVKQVIYSMILLPHTVWSLDFMQAVPAIQPFCISTALTDLNILGLKYITAAYPLFIVAVFLVIIHLYEKDYKVATFVCRPIGKCFTRFHQKLKIQNTLFDAFGTLIVLSYSKVCLVSFTLLGYKYLYSIEPNINHRMVLQLNASVGYCDSTHLPYFITAIVLIATYVALPPLLLLLYPLKPFQRCLDRLHLRGRLTEALFASFTSCYKDGTNGGRDCRYFASLYFILRIVPQLLNNAFPPDMFPTVSAIEISLTVSALLLLIMVRPYCKKIKNYSEIFIVACLTSVIVIGRYITDWNEPSMDLPLIFFIIIYTLPLQYMIVLISYMVYTRCSHCHLPQRRRKERQSSPVLCHRLLQPEDYSEHL